MTENPLVGDAWVPAACTLFSMWMKRRQRNGQRATSGPVDVEWIP